MSDTSRAMHDKNSSKIPNTGECFACVEKAPEERFREPEDRSETGTDRCGLFICRKESQCFHQYDSCSSLVLLTSSLQGQSNETALENTTPGTTSWQLTDPALSREIEGYAS